MCPDANNIRGLTMTRDESLTVRGVNETRRGYNKLQGITQVDTALSYYLEPSYLSAWLGTNAKFFTEPVHPSLVPRGLLFDGPPGCLSGDTVLIYKRGKRGGGRPITLSSLYRRFNGIPDGKNPPRLKNASTYLHSMHEDGRLSYNRIIKINESGKGNCIRVTTKSGRSLVLTPDHHVCLNSGEYVPAGSLTLGTLLRMKGSMLPINNGGKKKHKVSRREICVKHHPIAGLKVVQGVVYRRLHYTRVLMESCLNSLSLNSYINRLNKGNLAGLEFLPSDHEVHHIDGNPRNDRLDNLVVLSKAEHARLHSAYENFNVEYLISEAVVSVEPAGEVMTYDIQMDMPCINFVAEGFIVEGSGGCTGC